MQYALLITSLAPSSLFCWHRFFWRALNQKKRKQNVQYIIYLDSVHWRKCIIYIDHLCNITWLLTTDMYHNINTKTHLHVNAYLYAMQALLFRFFLFYSIKMWTSIELLNFRGSYIFIHILVRKAFFKMVFCYRF